MTREMFLKELRRVKENFLPVWELKYAHPHASLRIRAHSNGCSYCPITAVAELVAGKYYSPRNFLSAARTLELRGSLTCEILRAADDDSAAYKTMRAVLIDILRPENLRYS